MTYGEQVAADLMTWRDGDTASLCSAYVVSPPAVFDARAEHSRHVPGVSYIDAEATGRVYWFLVDPDLGTEDKREECKAMLRWLAREAAPDAHTFYGNVGPTDFSEWLWRDEAGAGWDPQADGSVLVTLSRDALLAWVSS